MHTPGPWEVEYGENGGAIEVFAPLTPASKPGGIGAVVRRRGISMPTSEEGKANARLIAASPRMLENLKYVAELLKSGLPLEAERESLLEVVELTIAKAEGRS